MILNIFLINIIRTSWFVFEKEDIKYGVENTEKSQNMIFTNTCIKKLPLSQKFIIFGYETRDVYLNIKIFDFSMIIMKFGIDFDFKNTKIKINSNEYSESISLSNEIIYQCKQLSKKSPTSYIGIRLDALRFDVKEILKKVYAEIDLYFLNLYDMFFFLNCDKCDWVSISKVKKLNKNHEFLNDSENYQTKESLYYSDFNFYRRYGNSDTLAVHKSTIIKRKFEFGYSIFIMDNCIIGVDVSIGPNTFLKSNCVVREHSRIGKNCILHENTHIGRNVIIGNENIFMKNVKIGSCKLPFYKNKFRYRVKEPAINYGLKSNFDFHMDHEKFKMQNNYSLYIGDCNIFMDSSLMKNFSYLKNNNFIGTCTIISNNCVIESKNLFSNLNKLDKNVSIGSNNIFESSVFCSKNIEIGSFNFLGINSYVNRKNFIYCFL